MKREDILQALDEISDARIEKTAQQPKKSVNHWYWYSGVAAVLAVAMLLGIFLPGKESPVSIENPNVPGFSQETIPPQNNTEPMVKPTVQPAAPAAPTESTKPTSSVGIQNLAATIAQAQYPSKSDYVDISKDGAGLRYYFSRTMSQFLQDDQGNKNVAFSPMNLYMALAMLAETTDGQTRAEILSLLGATDIESLRTQANALWRISYRTEDNPCTLANSLWLQDGTSYNQDTMNTLAAEYFASVYGVDFTSDAAGQAVAAWIDKETAGMLKEHTQALEFDPRTVMALVSTIYLQADWKSPFKEENNTQDIFNGTNGQTTCTFMHKSSTGGYYWGADYSAISKSLNGNHTMWFVLPEEGMTTEDLLQSGNYTELFLGGNTNRKECIVNLSMPKFDIDCKQNMISGLQDLGIKRVFQRGLADFTPSFPEMANELYVGMVEQATRVTVDEDGVAAAGYVVVMKPGSPMPPTEEVDFVLDRPFLFVITNSANIPLFAGEVNNP